MPIHPVPQLPRPALRIPIKDPTFGALITRITDPSMSPNEGTNKTLGFAHEYSRFPGLSADNQKIAVMVLGGQERGNWEIRSVATGGRLWQILTNGDPEFSWHRTDPNKLFYRTGNQICVFHVDTGQSETLMVFPQYERIGTNEEGRPSDAWDFYAFFGKSGNTTDLVVVDLIAKKILGSKKNVGAADWVSMSPSGNYVVAMWEDGQGVQSYTRELVPVRKLLPNPSHSDFAYDAQGNEVLVYQATEEAQLNELGCPNPPNGSPIASARLMDGQKKILLGECNKVDWTPVITGEAIGWWFTPHFSGIASRAKPGWVLVSTYCAPDAEQHPRMREIFWLALDGSGQVKPLAHHHSDVATKDDLKDYFAEPHATSSWDGSLVVFTSVWGQPWTRYDVYTIGAGAVVPPPPPVPVYNFVIPGVGYIRFTPDPKAK